MFMSISEALLEAGQLEASLANMFNSCEDTWRLRLCLSIASERTKGNDNQLTRTIDWIIWIIISSIQHHTST